MELGMWIFFIGLVVIFLSFYYWSTSTHNYWKNLGIPGPRPLPLVGNIGSVIFYQQALAERQLELYNIWKNKPFFGIFHGRIPILLVNDPELIKNILIRDFHVFPGRGLEFKDETRPLSGNLFNMEGYRWKVLRAKFRPAFTTVKLKQMVELMIECSEHFEIYLRKQVGKGNVIECREVVAKYTTDVIGSCVLGMDMKALEREDSEFRTIGRSAFASTPFRTFQKLFNYILPDLFKYLNVGDSSSQHAQFFINCIRDMIDYRQKHNIVRSDLTDILKDMKNNSQDFDFELTDNLLASQAYIFFLAGFETSSTTVSYALYEMAINLGIQERLRTEISNVMKKYNNKLSYDIINEMKYLNMVLRETLRKNPPGFELTRTAGESYKIPGHNVIIPKGTRVDIPLYSLQRDERYYPKPDTFDPERFNEENNDRHPMVYLPFGDGPKNCIGERFAMFQSKLGIIVAIKNFKVTPSKWTEVPYKIDKSSFVLSSPNGIHLNFDPII